MKEIIIAVVGSGALSALIAGLFNLLVNRKGRLSQIEGQLCEIDKKLIQTEKDELRTQLLLMISDYPDEKQEILRLAEHYFGDLHGNWYATTIFNNWLATHDIARPEWFERRRSNEQ